LAGELSLLKRPVFSNSSEAESSGGPGPLGPFAEIVSDSLAILRDEQPSRYLRVCEAMANRQLCIRTRDETFVVAFDRAPHCASVLPFSSASSDAALALSFEPTLIRDLVTAATSLERALLDEQLVVVGALDDIVACHDGLMAYLHGATRAPSFRGLWRRFRCTVLQAES
jgi:hypothetical protein